MPPSDELGRWIEPRDALHRLAGQGAFLLEAGRGMPYGSPFLWIPIAVMAK